MSDINDLSNKLSDVKLDGITSRNSLQPNDYEKKPFPKSSSIFLKKNFGSLASPKKKPSFQRNGLVTPVKKSDFKKFNKNEFFSDSPMAVDDPRWGKENKLLLKMRNEPMNKPAVIESPSKLNPSLDYKHNVQSGFKKFAKDDSPFKDPYSSLNNNTVQRAGASFLDNPLQYQTEDKLIHNLVESIGEEDETKEIERLKAKPLTDKDRKVKGLTINLLDHQVIGLKFLRKREKERELRKGGLLCDDMGLGKTVQTIALIVKNKPSEEDLVDKEGDGKSTSRGKEIALRKFKATLVVCPVSLTTQWALEIQKFAPHLKVFLYLGPKRPSDYTKLLDYDVVISSYDTIRSEHGKHSSPMYEVLWYRIVLDEAHTIKNKKSKVSMAVCDLASLRRWCLTGTPIQNSIEDLQSLLIFLRVSRLSDPSCWQTEIADLLKEGKSAKAFISIKEELARLMLRRTKSFLESSDFKLPPKKIHKSEIEFSKIEQKLYNNLRDHIVDDLKMNSEGTTNESADSNSDTANASSVQQVFSEFSSKKLGNKNSKGSNLYMYALVLLLRLRQMCCHWKLLTDLKTTDLEDMTCSSARPQSSISKASPSKRDMNITKEVDDLTNFMTSLTVNETRCEICFTEKVSSINSKTCSSCQEKLETTDNIESAKVLKLIEILKKDPRRKTIVFSQFREMLFLLGPILSRHGIKSVNYDGSLNLKQKDAALERLRNDQDTTVLLCSLRAGALGLNLTVASQVVLYDPWWNPQIEEQAIDRVYRIGQTRDVDVYKFAVKDTVETAILALQDVKRNLAKAVTDSDARSENELLNKLSQAELMKLFGMSAF